MKILAIETATAACSVALLDDDAVRERHEVAPRRHASLVLGMVDELLAESGLRLSALDAIAFGRGPGAFTGVRIAAGVVQGLALGAGLPVAPVSTLLALAQGCLVEAPAGQVLAVMDARMGEVYAAACRVGPERIAAHHGAEWLGAPAALVLDGEGDWLGVGSGFEAYPEALRTVLGARLCGTLPQRLPRAADVARLALVMCAAGELVDPELALPVYLRDRVATPPARS